MRSHLQDQQSPHRPGLLALAMQHLFRPWHLHVEHHHSFRPQAWHSQKDPPLLHVVGPLLDCHARLPTNTTPRTCRPCPVSSTPSSCLLLRWSTRSAVCARPCCCLTRACGRPCPLPVPVLSTPAPLLSPSRGPAPSDLAIGVDRRRRRRSSGSALSAPQHAALQQSQLRSHSSAPLVLPGILPRTCQQRCCAAWLCTGRQGATAAWTTPLYCAGGTGHP